MIVGQYYMHKNAMDVCFLCENEIRMLNHANMAYIGTWHNLGYMGQPWPLDEVVINAPDMTNWINITDKFNSKRTAGGLPT